MNRHLRTLALTASSAMLATAATITAVTPAARAETWANNNEWWYAMTEPGDGLVITGDDGPQNDSAFLVRDHLNQPIFAVLEAGGAAVLGDQFRVMHGSDPFNGQITLSPDNPAPAVCVRNGQLWIGGPDGRIWRCADLDGGSWNGAWWIVL